MSQYDSLHPMPEAPKVFTLATGNPMDYLVIPCGAPSRTSYIQYHREVIELKDGWKEVSLKKIFSPSTP